MLTAVALIASFLPMLIYAVIFSCFSRHRRLPLTLLAASFLWGALPALSLSRGLESWLHPILLSYPASTLMAELLESALIVPLVEESFKALVLLGIVRLFEGEMHAPTAGLIYGGSAGFGFAAAENIPYFLETYGALGTLGMAGQIILRTAFFGLNHAMYTGLIGAALALSQGVHSRGARRIVILAGFTLAVAAHGLHNALVISSTYLGNGLPLLAAFLISWSGVLLLVGVAIGLVILEGKILHAYLQHAAARHLLPEDDLPILQYPLLGVIVRAKVFLTGGFRHWRRIKRYHQKVAEAAFAWRQGQQGSAKAQAVMVDIERELQEFSQSPNTSGMR
jgi:RsiW-degrading membrane proteinase PrsW (M82 family)